MSRFEGPQGIVTQGLVLNLDAGDPDSYTRSQPPYVEVLVVAGGGSAGSALYHSGGGGAGGLIYNSAYQLTNAAAITVTIGAGGAAPTTQGLKGNNGSNSVFGSLTAIGGGGGGTYQNATGLNGGSGGGGGAESGVFGTGGQGTAGQGFNGGNYDGSAGGNKNGGGGGGASQSGQTGTIGTGGNGGNGQPYAISGTSTYYAGGGGGSTENIAITTTGGLGGGGNGNYNTGQNGTANTGGGGGAGERVSPATTGAGGSGIVIVRYPGLPAATGGTIAYLNGYTIHTFTTSGTFTPYLWNDISGNNNNGTLNNGTAFIPNVQGGYFNFDGTDDNVTIPASSIPSSATTNNISICFWSYGVSETTAGSIIEARDSGGARTVNIHLPWSNNVIYWDVAGSSYDRITYSLTAGQSLGWNFWSFTRNSSTGVMAIYQNGVILVSGGGYFATINVTTAAKIGSYTINTNYYPGRIGVAQIYNRPLSQAEITQNYNAQKSRFGL
jgi:hypothetical protein